MTGRERELEEMMEQRNVLQETYCAYRKQSGKRVKQETLEVDANYFTTKLMKEKMG